MMNDPFVEAVRKYAPEPSVILDIGSMDAAQAVFFNRAFQSASVFAFEPLPAHHAQCRAANVPLVEKAVLDYTGETVFHAIKPGTNSGASSVFVPPTQILPWDGAPIWEKITVPCIRIDDWAASEKITQIDAVWMDVQGAELQVLQGFGKLLTGVKVIQTEVETEQVYEGATSFVDLVSLMYEHDFIMVSLIQAWQKEADAIFVQKGLL